MVVHEGSDLVVEELGPLAKALQPDKVHEDPQPALDAADAIVVPAVLEGHVAAMYSTGATTLPVWPTCRSLGA